MCDSAPKMYHPSVNKIACLLVLILLTGCYRPLFDEKLPRHQYQSYDNARRGQSPAHETDVYGNKQPALRARLSDQ